MTGPSLLLWRAKLRTSVGRVAVLVLLLSFGGGAALAIGAGAVRTARAHERVVEHTNGYELETSYVPSNLAELPGIIAQIPGVAGYNLVVGFQVVSTERPIPSLTSFALANDPVEVDRPLVLEGRLPKGANEVLITESAAQRTGASIGQTIPVAVASIDFSSMVPTSLTVVGIKADELYADETDARPNFIFGAEFIDAYRDYIAWGAVAVALAPGADRDATIRDLHARGMFVDNDRQVDRERASAAVRPLVVTLAALAAMAGLAIAVIVAQAVQRLVWRNPSETRALSAAGCSRGMLRAADVGIAVTVGLLGCSGAIGVAVLASPLFPQGQARRLEVLGGFDVDLPMLLAGGLALFVVTVSAVAVTTQRRPSSSDSRVGLAPSWLATRPAAGTGVRFATARRGLGSTVTGIALGLAFVALTVTFAGSMANLVDRPELSGFTWDIVGRDAYATIDTRSIAEQLRDDPSVERVTGLSFVDAAVNGRSVPASVWEAIKGSPWPPIVTGRAPEGPREVLVSGRTLAESGHELGDTVTVELFRGDNTVQTSSNPMIATIVGTAISPTVRIPGSVTPRLDEGVLLRTEDLMALVPPGSDDVFTYGGAVFFDLAPGVEPAVVREKFPDGLPDPGQIPTDWFTSAKPGEIIQTTEAVDILLVVIVVLLVGVAATVTHGLMDFVRRRRSAYAVLKAIGFTPGQVRTTALWQGAVALVLAMAIGLPIGVAAGRWLYQIFAADIGVAVVPVVPWLGLLVAVVCVVVIVLGAALVPAQRARQTDAARELRPE